MTAAKSEVARRSLNVMEALVIAALIGLTGLIFSMREAVIRLQVGQENMNRTLSQLQTQLADVPALTQRVTKNEVRLDAIERALNAEETRGK